MNFATQASSPWTKLVREGITSRGAVLRVQAENNQQPQVLLFTARDGMGTHVCLSPSEALALGAELMQAAMAAHPRLKEAAA
jgi:hypothetical protein